MSGQDLVFHETAVNYMMDDIARATSKLRESGAQMSEFVEHELGEWTDTSEARQAQKACAQRLDTRLEELSGALDALKQAFEDIRQAGIKAETLAFAAVD